MRFAFWVIGCQMNVADSERLARVLTEQGHVQVPDTAGADLVVLMSCSVRQTAEDRLWGHLREVAQLKRAAPLSSSPRAAASRTVTWRGSCNGRRS